MSNIIKKYIEKKKQGYYDWKEAPFNPECGKINTTVMIPEHGNHPVFDNPNIKGPVKETEKKKTFFTSK